MSASISLKEAAALVDLERDGRRPHYATLMRWAHRGIAGRRLRIRRIGGRIYTTREAVMEFLDGLNLPDQTLATPSRSRDAARRLEEDHLS